MDWRNRKYFLVDCGGWLHNLWISELKAIKSVKIHNPYSWNKNIRQILTNIDMIIPVEDRE